MRSRLLLLTFAAALACAVEGFSQEAPKARLWDDCDTVCFTLAESIKAQPETAEMRLEDALVIRRECAGEIMTAALEAAGSQAALRDKLIKTALKVAPEKSRVILHAVRTPRGRAPVVDEEALLAKAIVVKKAIIPEEEIRRAQMPVQAAAVSIGPREPEVRRAIRLTEAPPPIEIRPAEMADSRLPRLRLSQRRR